jgi:hypothetical protein
MAECRKKTESDEKEFTLSMWVDQDGTFMDVIFDPPTATANCVVFRLASSKQPFPAAPAPNFWLKFDFDPKNSHIALHEGM